MKKIVILLSLGTFLNTTAKNFTEQEVKQKLEQAQRYFKKYMNSAHQEDKTLKNNKAYIAALEQECEKLEKEFNKLEGECNKDHRSCEKYREVGRNHRAKLDQLIELTIGLNAEGMLQVLALQEAHQATQEQTGPAQSHYATKLQEQRLAGL